MELRKRTGLGTVAFADACDRGIRSKEKRHGQALVCVRRSSLPTCSGVGVFAARSVPAGTVMTAYPHVVRGARSSPRRSARASQSQDYAYEWTRCGVTLDGDPALLSRWSSKRNNNMAGVAHLANDAIHPEVTGRDNNCDFLEDRSDPRRPRLHLVTKRAVRRGEELLVSYSLGYWLARETAVPDAGLRRWIACHRRVSEALPELFLWEYVGAFGGDDGQQRLEYVARCSANEAARPGGGAERGKCEACEAGDECRLRRVEVRWAGRRRRESSSFRFRYLD